jgi:chromate reductase, NAD(P)H dehydrogenase (quinone)
VSQPWLAVEELRKNPQVSVDVIDREGLALPPPGTGLDSAATEDLQSRTLRAAGVVLATPAYRGSFSSMMKSMIENLGFPSVLAGKTVARFGVAGGSIGAIKSLERLRGVVSHAGNLLGCVHPIGCARLTTERMLREGPGSVPQDILAGRN